jgi:hypothetical protein
MLFVQCLFSVARVVRMNDEHVESRRIPGALGTATTNLFQVLVLASFHDFDNFENSTPIVE